MYQSAIEKAGFKRSTDIASNTVNIVFMTYVFENDPKRPGQFRLTPKRVEGMSQANLQQAILYKEAPSRDAFKGKIFDALRRK